jgi:hypothetical protein
MTDHRAGGAGQDRDGDRPPGSEDPLSRPLDAVDPRFTGAGRVEVPARARELIATRGPGASPMDPRVRLLRGIIPALAIAGVVLIGAVFFRALAPGPSTVALGDEAAIREAVAEQPQRICREQDGLPCAWLVVVDDRILALSTSGPIREEFGRQGVGWCPTSGYFGSNASGSRYDPAGNLVAGPSPRGLDRYAVRVSEVGEVVVDFNDRIAGRRAGTAREPIPPAGPDCADIPFGRDIDLRLD